MSLSITGTNIYGGLTISTAGTSPPPTGDSVIGYSEMSPPVIPGDQLEDTTATINSPTGFTINDDTKTGVAIPACTANNITWLNTNYTVVPGTYTCTWGAGSTVASSSIYVISLPSVGNPFVFFIQGQTGAATYNYPFTFSV
jgi:hypothetical protein